MIEMKQYQRDEQLRIEKKMEAMELLRVKERDEVEARRIEEKTDAANTMKNNFIFTTSISFFSLVAALFPIVAKLLT
jgi:hypothetical protein